MCNDFTNSLIQFQKTNIKKKYQRLTHDKLLLSMPQWQGLYAKPRNKTSQKISLAYFKAFYYS